MSNHYLVTQLHSLGLLPGDTVMLHASMRAVGKDVESPNRLIKVILDAIGPAGTMMMYIGCEPEFDAIGRGKYTSEEEREIKQRCPAFDPTASIARKDYGVVAEYFRQWPGVICSNNPGARMAAFGSKALWLTENHPLNYGYGPGSPLAKFCEVGGKVLLLGSDLDQVTLLHYSEHIVPIDNKRIVKYKTPLNINSQRTWVDVEEYDTSIGIIKWPDRFFATIVTAYMETNNIKPEKVGQANSYLIDANSLIEFSLPLMISTSCG